MTSICHVVGAGDGKACKARQAARGKVASIGPSVEMWRVRIREAAFAGFQRLAGRGVALLLVASPQRVGAYVKKSSGTPEPTWPNCSTSGSRPMPTNSRLFLERPALAVMKEMFASRV